MDGGLAAGLVPQDLDVEGLQQPAEADDSAERANTFPNDATFTNAQSHLRASANRHQRVKQHLRVVDGPDQVIVDLCNELGQVVEITARGFDVRDLRTVDGKPWFRRNEQMLAQVLPAEVAPEDVVKTLEEARLVLGVDGEQWKVVLDGLIGAYFPSISRPGWWLTGPSGSGKTTRGRMIAGWVDPVDYLGGQLDLKRDERNARTTASNSFVYTTDNLTKISQDENDWWCRPGDMGHQRLDAHQRQAPLRVQPLHLHPPRPGRLARNSHRREPLRPRLRHRPVQRLAQPERLHLHRLAASTRTS